MLELRGKLEKREINASTYAQETARVVAAIERASRRRRRTALT